MEKTVCRVWKTQGISFCQICKHPAFAGGLLLTSCLCRASFFVFILCYCKFGPPYQYKWLICCSWALPARAVLSKASANETSHDASTTTAATRSRCSDSINRLNAVGSGPRHAATAPCWKQSAFDGSVWRRSWIREGGDGGRSTW